MSGDGPDSSASTNSSLPNSIAQIRPMGRASQETVTASSTNLLNNPDQFASGLEFQYEGIGAGLEV
jgi:hypothetical protein